MGEQKGTSHTYAGLQGWAKAALAVWYSKELQVCMGEAASSVPGNPRCMPRERTLGEYQGGPRRVLIVSVDTPGV